MSALEIAAAVRHEVAGVLDRCVHWIMLLRQSEQMRGMPAEDAVREVETELLLLEQGLRKLNAAFSLSARPGDG
ncbi:MAG TPA: hypothetical protein VFI17_09090 [Solirubrobacterales bacterium]|nr:hypothetical protein [Solirubrobacterales bacterium]